MFDLKLLW